MIHPRVFHVIRDRAHLLQIATGVENMWRDDDGPFYVYAGRGSDPITRGAHRGYLVDLGPRPELGNPFPFETHGRESMRLWLDYLRDDPKGREIAAWAARPIFFRDGWSDPSCYVFGCYCAGVHPTCHAEPLARLGDGEPLHTIRADILHRLELDVRQARLFPEATP